MAINEQELETRSMRLILSGILRMLGDLSEMLPYDAETLPVLLRVVGDIAMQLKEAEELALKERESMMEEISKKLSKEIEDLKEDPKAESTVNVDSDDNRVVEDKEEK